MIVVVILLLVYNYYKLPSTQGHYVFKNLTVAHRGGQPSLQDDNNDFPENSLAAFKWASMSSSIDGIELDTQLSKDHIPMVIHDTWLHQIFDNCHGKVSDYTCAELKTFLFKRKIVKTDMEKNDLYKTERILTLEEAIQFLQGTQLKVVIDIKEVKHLKLMASIIDKFYRQYPFLYERSCCASFLPISLYYLRLLNPRIITALVYLEQTTDGLIRVTDDLGKPLPAFVKYNIFFKLVIDNICQLFATPLALRFVGANIILIQKDGISGNVINKYRENDIIVAVWCANTKEEKNWFKSQGVTIIADTPLD
ncbi:unnamed protein product [Didymodactylos carnosus]|uniref:GP-PDE domain-containing protein n=1 Tax=Didymodactylos carnosus TaxID=1234261 RepID=A0A815EY30_9BILA|nr:unnamed protein product [Didymodactylos carnosus]CAF1318477.1 unnamed protein product [Didymodactylos carnosus]CAF3750168.1 unnamed protein product [Didymodactylos carnosus]CAF4162301.1 unnamed protein product [Didymodactylos carnosus]